MDLYKYKDDLFFKVKGILVLSIGVDNRIEC